MPTSDDDLRATIARLKTLLDKATPQNIDTAEIKEDGYFVCPCCDGLGEVQGTLYLNYDGVAANVNFSGIGPEHKAAEQLFRALLPAAPALLDRMKADRKRIEELAAVLAEIVDYRGGANNATEDEYVMDRARRALKGKANG